MTKIISLDQYREERQVVKEREDEEVLPEFKSLTDQLKEIKMPTRKLEKPIEVIKEGEVKEIFRQRICQKMINEGMVESNILLAGQYVADVIDKRLKKPFEIMTAFELLEKANANKNDWEFLEAGNTCLMINAVFPERGNWRQMSPEYYRDCGKAFYWKFYLGTEREMGCTLGKNYDLICGVVASTFQEMKEEGKLKVIH